MTDIILAPALSFEEYAECFRVYRQHSNQPEVMLDWLKNRLPGILAGRRDISVLSVGCGSGDFDRKVLEFVSAFTDHVSYLGVEPNPLHCAAAWQNLSSLTGPKIKLAVAPVSFEFLETSERFDLILFIHCLYYIPDRGSALERAMRLLSPGGRIVVMHQTPAGINQIQRRFLRQIKGQADEMVSSADLAQLLNRMGARFQYGEIDHYLDVACCFEPGSRQGRLMLNFFLESDLGKLSLQRRREVVSYLREISHMEEDRRRLSQPVGVLQIEP